MTKKSFWKRWNRGFLVSMALLAAVLIYILITQLMLLSDRREIRALAEDYRGYAESTYVLTDEQIDSLKDAEALQQEKGTLTDALSSLFVEDSEYIGDAAQKLMNSIPYQTEGVERVRQLSDARMTDFSCMVDQNAATCSVTYSYTVSGDFMNYSTGNLEEKDDVPQDLKLSVNCKKVGGTWKLYRVSQAEWQSGQTAVGGDSD